MPRIRSLRPEFWTRRRLAAAAPAVRLVMVGLIQLADDEGRLEADPVILRSQLFAAGGIEQADFDRALAFLAEAGEIVLYEEDTAPYAAIPGWRDKNSWQYQQISKRQPSRLPPPPEPDSEGDPDRDATPSGDGRDDSGNLPGAIPEQEEKIPGGSREQGTGSRDSPPLPSPGGEGGGCVASPEYAPLTAGEGAIAGVLLRRLENVQLRVETAQQAEARKRAAHHAVQGHPDDRQEASIKHRALLEAERLRRDEAAAQLRAGDAEVVRGWIERLQDADPATKEACDAAFERARQVERDQRRDQRAQGRQG